MTPSSKTWSRGRRSRPGSPSLRRPARLAGSQPTEPFDDEIDAQVLDGQIRAELLDLETLRTWEINPMTYAGLPGGAIDGLMKRDFAPAGRPPPPGHRPRAARSRPSSPPRKANLKNPPKEFTDLAIRMAKGSVGFFEGSVATWAQGAAGGGRPAPCRVPAGQRRQQDRLGRPDRSPPGSSPTSSPAPTGRYAIGPDANFLAKLKYEEMVEIPLPELLAKGEAQLAKDYAAFVATARQIDPSRTPLEVMRRLSDDHPTAADLIPSVRRSIDEARQYLVDQADRDDPLGGPPADRGDPALTPDRAASPRWSTPGPYRDEGHRGVLLRHAGREGLGRQARRRAPSALQPAGGGDDQRPRGLPRATSSSSSTPPKFPTKTRKLVFCGTNAEGLGALLRADDGRRGLRQRRPEDPPGPAPGGACSATAATSSG